MIQGRFVFHNWHLNWKFITVNWKPKFLIPQTYIHMQLPQRPSSSGTWWGKKNLCKNACSNTCIYFIYWAHKKWRRAEISIQKVRTLLFAVTDYNTLFHVNYIFTYFIRIFHCNESIKKNQKKNQKGRKKQAKKIETI